MPRFISRVERDWPYQHALDFFAAARQRVVAGGQGEVVVCDHASDVITLGRHTPRGQLLATPDTLCARGVVVHRVERGGGATAHGPGQAMLYPVVDIAKLGHSIPQFTALLEEVAVRTLTAIGINASAGVDGPGVFVDGQKIASIGFRVSRGVLSHGLSLNVDNDLTVFDLITPCGRNNAKITSVRALTKSSPDVAYFLRQLLVNFVQQTC